MTKFTNYLTFQHVDSIEDLDPKALDDLWLEVFGWTYRDAEQLSWVWSE